MPFAIFLPFSSLLLLPRLGLWSRDKAAKGTAAVAIGVAGRSDATTIKVEVVDVASIREGSRRPAITVPASEIKLISADGIDPPTPHKEKRAERNIICITIHWASTG